MSKTRSSLTHRSPVRSIAFPCSARCAGAPVYVVGSISRFLDLLSLDCRRRAVASLSSSRREGNLLTKQVGELIRRLRRAQGLSQEEFGARCGLHRTYIGALERGEKTMTIETANKVAHALRLSLAQLFNQVERLPGGQEDEQRETGVDVSPRSQRARIWPAPQ